MRKHETDINVGSNTFAQPIDIDPNNKNRIQFFKKTIKNMKMYHVNKKSILQKKCCSFANKYCRIIVASHI